MFPVDEMPKKHHPNEEALKKAVAEAMAKHRLHGIPIAIWRDGKVVLVPPDQMGVSDVQPPYTLSRKRKIVMMRNFTNREDAFNNDRSPQ